MGKKNKGDRKNETNVPAASARTEDARFDKVYSDPRFMAVPNKVKKVEIDSRFSKMLTDKSFNQVAPTDKYGRKVDQLDKHALQNYTLQKPKLSKEEIALQETKEKFYDENG